MSQKITVQDGNLTFDALNGVVQVTGTIETSDAAGWTLLDEAATGTNPTLIPNKVDLGTGIGSAATDQLSLVAGGLEAVRYEEASSNVIVINEIDAAVVASTTQTQGQTPLTSSYNVVVSIANDNDVVTMPPAAEGKIITIINRDSNNILQVFPASGDSLEAGTNVSVTMPPQSSRTFIGSAGNSIYSTISESLTTGGSVVIVASVTTTTASTTEILAIPIVSGSSEGFEILVIGREDATGDTVFVRVFGAIENTGGTTVFVGGLTTDRTDVAGSSTWVITVAADDTTDELTVDVTGEAAHTIDWKVRVNEINI